MMSRKDVMEVRAFARFDVILSTILPRKLILIPKLLSQRYRLEKEMLALVKYKSGI